MTSIVTQPPHTWFQFGEGPIQLCFHTTNSAIVASNWTDMKLTLLYHDDMRPIDRGTRSIREVTRNAVGDTLLIHVKVREISKNHQSRAFCLALGTGEDRVVTNEFEVKTKRTKRKAHHHTGSIITPFRATDPIALLIKLQWHVNGTCPLCTRHMTSGHSDTCQLHTTIVHERRR